MDVEKYRKLAESNFINEQQMKAVGNEIQDYDDKKQDLYIERSEKYRPIKESINDKQDELIEKLTENQNMLLEGLEELLPQPLALPQPPHIVEQLPHIVEQLPQPPPPPKKRYKSSIYNLDKDFTPNDLKTLEEYDFLPPSEMRKMSLDRLQKIDELALDTIKQFRNSKGGLKNNPEKNKEKIMEIDEDSRVLRKYRKRIEIVKRSREVKVTTDEDESDEGEVKVGKGIRKYKQPKRNAYKISGEGQYGDLLINTEKLFNNHIVEARPLKGGAIFYEQPVDKTLIDLLTKKYNPKSKYTEAAIQVFQDLSRLANIPKHKSSGKSKLLRGGKMYFTSPEELVDRLTLLTGIRAAGNTNIQMRNEILEILDLLLKNKKISNKNYDDYIQKYL